MTTNSGASQDDLARWAGAIGQLHFNTSADRGDERAVANLWSGFGFRHGPPEVQQLVLQAIEVEYLAALRDVRDGQFDAELPTWRPDLE